MNIWGTFSKCHNRAFIWSIYFVLQTGMGAGKGVVEYKHGVENDVIRNHDRNVINVEMCMARDTAPKVVAMESVLLNVSDVIILYF